MALPTQHNIGRFSCVAGRSSPGIAFFGALLSTPSCAVLLGPDTSGRVVPLGSRVSSKRISVTNNTNFRYEVPGVSAKIVVSPVDQFCHGRAIE